MFAAEVLVVHVIPSEDVMTRLPDPESATATNKLSSALHVTPRQLLSAAETRVLHVETVAFALARDVLNLLFNTRILI